MIDRTQIRTVVFAAIDKTNELLLDGNALPKDEATVLVGDGASLDSMGFVNFVVALEQEYMEAFGVGFDLVEQLNSANKDSERVSTVGQLIDFLQQRSRS